MISFTELVLLATLGLAGWIFRRLHVQAPPPSPAAAPPGAPPGTPFVALGQYAVAPDKQWLLIRPGH